MGARIHLPSIKVLVTGFGLQDDGP